jgi:Protein of unknown function (DUF4065)
VFGLSALTKGIAMAGLRLPEKRKKAPVIALRPNKEKILQALLYLIEEADRKGVAITQYTILKAFFFADRAHLNRYGRPITFDNYKAMKDGPVASLIYDILKNNVNFPALFGIAGPLWERTPAPEISARAFRFHSCKTKPDLDVLSESDIEALSDALTIATTLSFGQIKRLTHEDPAYIDAWEDEDPALAYDMSLGMLFDTPNFDQAKEIAFLSQHQ